MTLAGLIARGSLLRIADMFVLLAATFLVTPILLGSLGDRLFGFWSLTGAIVGYYGFLDLGLSAAATRYMSQALGKGDAAELERVAGTAYGLFSAAAVVMLAATVLCALACPWFLKDPAEAALMARLIAVMGTAAAVGFPSKVYAGLLSAGIRHDLAAGISIARNLAYYGALYLFLRAGWGIMTVAGVGFTAVLLERWAQRAACRSRFPGLRVSWKAFDRARVGVMFDYGWKILVCQLGDILRFRLDSMLIAAFLGASMVTHYAVGVRLVEGFSRLVMSFTSTMLPVFSRYEGRGDREAIRAALLKATKAGTVLSAFLGGSAIFYGRAFIERWLGPGYEQSYAVVAVLSLAAVIGLPHSPGVNMLYGLSKHKVYAVLSLCEGAANLALSLVFLQRFGIVGAALGTLAEMAVFKLLIQPVYVCRVAGLPLRVYLVDTIFLTQVKTAALLLPFFWAAADIVGPDYRVIFACAGLQAMLFAPAAYFLILDDEERRLVRETVTPPQSWMRRIARYDVRHGQP